MEEYEKVNSIIASMHGVLINHPNLKRIWNKEADAYKFFKKDGDLFLCWGPWDHVNNWDDPDRYFLIFDKDGESQKFLFRDWYELSSEEIKQKVHTLLNEDYTIKTNSDFIKIIQDKVVTKTYHELCYFELERLVQLIYGQKWSFVADIECGNDSVHTFGVDGDNEEYDQKKLDIFKSGSHVGWIAGVLLNDLAAQGVIPKGEWMISVSW